MDNSEKLSLFRDGNSKGMGFTDIEVGRGNLVNLSSEELFYINNEVNNFNQKFWWRGPWVGIGDGKLCAVWCKNSDHRPRATNGGIELNS